LYLAAATQWGASPYSPSYGYPATDFDWTSNSVDFYGYVNLSPVAQQEILTQYPAGACVTGVAFDVDHTYNNLTRGRVYLYLNGTGHGLSLPFGDEAF
ncbi:MAG TPA: hypothetical protein VL588_06420, partial [Bdellovibrionota bacterium]|nr:hypothetical protein [Bdellovibrionota bacterium]